MQDAQGWIWLAIIGFWYFFPTIVAVGRNQRNAGAIFVLDLFLGWTVIGWVAALVWAFVYQPREVR